MLLDVRNADEWEAGHAPAAKWVPLGELEGARFQLPINRQIVCVCRSGGAVRQGRGRARADGLRRGEHGRGHEGLGRRRGSRSSATTAPPAKSSDPDADTSARRYSSRGYNRTKTASTGR